MLGLNLQWGFTGLFNVGVAGFVAVGAYTSAILTTPEAADRVGGFGWPVAAGWLAAMATSGLAGLLVGALALRLRNDHLAITTFGVAVTIQLGATNAQAALSVRVDDVDPSGKATPLTNGLQSAAYRAVDPSRSRYVDGVMIQPWHPFTAASSAPLVPGEAVLVPVEVFPTAALIRSGHRLRVAISSSNQAQGVWPRPLQSIANGNVSTIYSDPARPSSIVLPVVPASVLK